MEHDGRYIAKLHNSTTSSQLCKLSNILEIYRTETGKNMFVSFSNRSSFAVFPWGITYQIVPLFENTFTDKYD